MSSNSPPQDPMKSVQVKRNRMFRWPEWATLSATCFDKNSLPKRALNLNLSFHCSGHAGAATTLRSFYSLPKLSLQWPCRCHCCAQGWIPFQKGRWTRTWAFITAAMQVPPLRSGVFYSLPKLSLQWPCRCHCCAKGWIPRQPTRLPLGVTRAQWLLHSRLKAP